MKINSEKFKNVVSKSGLTVRDLALRAGYTERRIYQLMAGKCTNINPRVGDAIAKKLGCKITDMTGDINNASA